MIVEWIHTVVNEKGYAVRGNITKGRDRLAGHNLRHIHTGVISVTEGTIAVKNTMDREKAYGSGCTKYAVVKKLVGWFKPVCKLMAKEEGRVNQLTIHSVQHC